MYTNMQARGTGDLVLQYAPLVKRIAYHLLARLPDSIQVEDLIQSGMLGLLEASGNFDDHQGASFGTYAGIRIRGAMLDEVRKSDWTPRSVHRKSREVAEAMRQIENRTGRDARDTEIAEELSITLDEYHKILQDSVGCRVFSTDELSSTDHAEDGDNPGVLEGLTQDNFRDALINAISNLPERERLVTSFYYDDELNLREIGEVLNVSESRVCQIHSQAMLRLRARMSDWIKPD
jgi:RNA polymerase sigma factor for flagellar operon FliA